MPETIRSRAVSRKISHEVIQRYETFFKLAASRFFFMEKHFKQGFFIANRQLVRDAVMGDSIAKIRVMLLQNCDPITGEVTQSVNDSHVEWGRFFIKSLSTFKRAYAKASDGFLKDKNGATFITHYRDFRMISNYLDGGKKIKWKSENDQRNELTTSELQDNVTNGDQYNPLTISELRSTLTQKDLIFEDQRSKIKEGAQGPACSKSFFVGNQSKNTEGEGTPLSVQNTLSMDMTKKTDEQLERWYKQNIDDMEVGMADFVKLVKDKYFQENSKEIKYGWTKAQHAGFDRVVSAIARNINYEATGGAVEKISSVKMWFEEFPLRHSENKWRARELRAFASKYITADITEDANELASRIKQPRDLVHFAVFAKCYKECEVKHDDYYGHDMLVLPKKYRDGQFASLSKVGIAYDDAVVIVPNPEITSMTMILKKV